MKISEKIHRAVSNSDSVLIAGLDPDFDRIPLRVRESFPDEDSAVFHFCAGIIEAVSPYVCGFKLNLAFFEALGANGMQVFLDVRNQIPADKLIIADAKRGDIGNTAARYAHAFFTEFDCDFITINPLMGFETIEPFIQNEEKGVFVLALTSNNGASDIFLQSLNNGQKVCAYIAQNLQNLQNHASGTIGMVVGATQTGYFNDVLPHFSSAPLLLPGIGAQGGSVEDVVKALNRHIGYAFPVISRAIMYASRDTDWKEKATEAARFYADSCKPLVRYEVS